ncbi:hypothetical protein GOARA_088_00690 [Gordonia araii NBRC 100433]|uniref:Mce-associated membrane protein n=1 Tax=Gordonia araii NBRC 100433 TaxID=1073574 RepID=G7H7I0_9ACTN|nr:hypothetical protein [Gordonia araii]NNG98488.1 hypothetical protein [Gordonia araii NBRC 100433]GAB11805.1 hypothetical protein GOARA_088_00690 [Gordonia araii NBRC 100433]
MSDLPPKKKRPRVAGQPRPGTGQTGREAASGKRPAAGSSRRAPIQRLGSSGGSASAKPVAPKTAPAKTAQKKKSASPKAAAKPVVSSAGDGKNGGKAGAVAKSAPTRRPTGEASSRGPAILAGLGALALLVGLLGLWHPGAVDGRDKSFVDSNATSEVLGQTENAACAILGPRRGETVDKWIGTSRSVLVGAARAEWEKQLTTNRQMIEQTGQTNDCRIDAIGVRELTGAGDGSTGQVLGSLVISMDQGGMAAGSIVVGIQYQVVRQDGKWKISRVDAW